MLLNMVETASCLVGYYEPKVSSGADIYNCDVHLSEVSLVSVSEHTALQTKLVY